MSAVRSQWQDSSRVFHTRAEEYDSWFNDSLLFDIETAAIRALAIPVVSPALEIGVGPGRFAEALGSRLGIDPAFAPLKIAKTRDIAVCQAVGEALPFRNNSLAQVSLFFTLCFVQNPATVFSEARRVLKDKGHLIVGFVPSGSQWGENLQQKKEKGHPFYEHANFLSVKEVLNLLHEQGLSISHSVASLYQAPGNVKTMESPHTELDEKSGFTVIAATKK